MKSFFVRVALIIFTAAMAGLRGHATEIVSVCSGNWGAATTWSGGIVPTANDTVTILSGDTVIIESSGKHCSSLTVEQGAKLFANKSTVTSSTRYIYVYGDILCNGQIGNDTVYDLIGFNLEGRFCTISGTGLFDASRIRKYDNISDSTTVSIAMDIRLRGGGTVIYNNRSGTVFSMVIEPGVAVDIPGDGTTPGNVAIDGINGAASSTGGGGISVSGTLRISGILYLTNSNSANPVTIAINTGGLIETASISCPNSGASGHLFSIADGGILKLTSGDWGEIGFTNNTYVFAAGSTVCYTGDTMQVVGNPTDYHHLILSGAGEKRPETDLFLSGNLTIETEAVLEIAAGTAVSVTGDGSLSGPECLILRSPTDAGSPASLIVSGQITGTGTVLIERWLSSYITADDSRFHFVSSPVTNQPIQPVFVKDPPDPLEDFYRWDEPTGTWVNSKEASGNWNPEFQPGDDRTFHPGTGYLVAYPENQVKPFTGFPNQGDQNPEISYTSGVYGGFTLIGNPYCSALQAAIGTWEKSNVDNAVWVWNGETGNYVTWNGTVGTLTDGVIPAMQGFFIHGNGPDPVLTIPASSRVHSSCSYLKAVDQDVLTITVNIGDYADGIVLHLNPDATILYDNLFDVVKMFGASTAPQLYWLDQQIRLSINERPYVEGEVILPIGFIAGSDGDYAFRFRDVVSFAVGEEVILEDLSTAQRINIRTDSLYTFSSLQGTHEDRFVLHIGNSTGLDEDTRREGITISTHHQELEFHGLPSGNGSVPVTIVDMSGRSVSNTTVSAENPFIETTLPSGYYVVTISTEKFPVHFKAFIGQ